MHFKAHLIGYFSVATWSRKRYQMCTSISFIMAPSLDNTEIINMGDGNNTNSIFYIGVIEIASRRSQGQFVQDN
jgi:hypothetical protein